MKASGLLFTKPNPFQTEPMVGKNNRPSQNTTSGMVRSKESPISTQQTQKAESQQKIGKQDHGFDSTEPIFSEIWSFTEPSSPSETSGMDASKLSSNTMKAFDPDTQQVSMLARYVQRFRHGQPQSREERQQIDSTEREEQPSFWWTSPSLMPPSSVPETTNEEHRLPHYDRSTSPCRGSSSILSDTSQCELVNTDILQLQERASGLLRQGDFCPGEESIPVSSDGLGCSDFSSPASVDEPVRRPLISSLLKCTTVFTAKDSIQAISPSVIPTLAPPTRPEEDILFQWRLRRKMEKAKEWHQSLQHSSQQGFTLGWRGHSQHHPSEYPLMPPQSIHIPDLSRGASQSQNSAPLLNTIDQQPCPTTLNSSTLPAMVASSTLVSPPQALAHVHSHMHLLCDILPCPNQSSPTNLEQRLPHRLYPQSNILLQTMQNSDIKHMSPPEPPLSAGIEKKHKTITEAMKKVKVKTKQLEKNENIPIPAKEQKKLSGVYSRQSVSKNVIPSTEQHQQRLTYSSKQSSFGGEAPPPSPIHSALGQVVSEVLFPSVAPSPAQKIATASLLPSCSVAAPTQLPCNPPNAIEVVSQLLQEAEDSDEKEFEDDPLLQVLRKQRKWVKEQINEVDTILKEFADEPQNI